MVPTLVRRLLFYRMTKTRLALLAVSCVLAQEALAQWNGCIVKFNNGDYEYCDIGIHGLHGRIYKIHGNEILYHQIAKGSRESDVYATEIVFLSSYRLPRELNLGRGFNGVTNIVFLFNNVDRARINGEDKYYKTHILCPRGLDRDVTIWYDPDFEDSYHKPSIHPFIIHNQSERIKIREIEHGMLMLFRTRYNSFVIWKGKLEITDGIGKDWINYETLRHRRNIGVIQILNGKGSSMFFRIKPQLEISDIPAITIPDAVPIDK